MSTGTATDAAERTDTKPWIAGAVGGLAGGVVFGAMLTMMMPQVIAGAIPALWGLSGMAAGWLVHLVNSLVFGLVFAAVVENVEGFRGYANTAKTSWLLGAVWGVVLWIVAAALVMPLWLQALGFPMAPPFPNFSPASLPGHIVYGVVLGLLYPYAEEW